MSQVKLNPYVDLGLSSDPTYQPDPASLQQTSNTATPSPVQSTPNFGGITDLSSMSQTSQASTSTPNLYTSVNQSDLTPKEEIKVVSSLPETETKGSNTIFFTIAIILFLASVAAVVFFVLRYMNIV